MNLRESEASDVLVDLIEIFKEDESTRAASGYAKKFVELSASQFQTKINNIRAKNRDLESVLFLIECLDYDKKSKR